MLIVGITGGIGSGKSIISSLLRMMDYPVYDSDSRSKELCDTNSTIRTRLSALLGSDLYVDNRLNRPLLASLIFKDSNNRSLANQIIHPIVFEDFEKWSLKQSSNLVFVESAILFQSGFSTLVNKSIVVHAPETLRVRRVMDRDTLTSHQVSDRICAQGDLSSLIVLSNFVIYNDDNHLLIPQIEEILIKLQTV